MTYRVHSKGVGLELGQMRILMHACMHLRVGVGSGGAVAVATAVAVAVAVADAVLEAALWGRRVGVGGLQHTSAGEV